MLFKKKKISGVYFPIFFLVYFFLYGFFSSSGLVEGDDGYSNAGAENSQSLITIQRALCSFKPDQELAGYLEIFIKKMEEFTDPQNLDDWLLNTAVNKIISFSIQLKKCKTNIEIKAEKNPDLRDRIEDRKSKIDRVNGGIKRLLDYIEEEKSHRSELAALQKSMPDVSSLYLIRTEWPPASSCPKCEEYWLMLHQISKYKGERYPENYINLGDLLKNLQLLKNKKEAICNLLNQLKQIDLRDIDENYQYYSWTETRKTIGKILLLLNNETVGNICQIH